MTGGARLDHLRSWNLEIPRRYPLCQHASMRETDRMDSAVGICERIGGCAAATWFKVSFPRLELRVAQALQMNLSTIYGAWSSGPGAKNPDSGIRQPSRSSGRRKRFSEAEHRASLWRSFRSGQGRNDSSAPCRICRCVHDRVPRPSFLGRACSAV